MCHRKSMPGLQRTWIGCRGLMPQRIGTATIHMMIHLEACSVQLQPRNREYRWMKKHTIYQEVITGMTGLAEADWRHIMKIYFGDEKSRFNIRQQRMAG